MVTEYVYIKIKIWIRAAHCVNIGVQIKELGPLKMTCKINFSDENQIVFENDCMVYIREGVTNRGKKISAKAFRFFAYHCVFMLCRVNATSIRRKKT